MNTQNIEKYFLIIGHKIASARRNRAEKMDNVAKATGTSIKVISQIEILRNTRASEVLLQYLMRYANNWNGENKVHFYISS